MNSFQTAERTAVLLALLAAALVFSIGSAMSQTETIWSEDFTGETGLTTSGDQWTAITPANVIAAVSDDEKFKVNGNNSGSGGTCIWTPEFIVQTPNKHVELRSSARRNARQCFL